MTLFAPWTVNTMSRQYDQLVGEMGEFCPVCWLLLPDCRCLQEPSLSHEDETETP